MKLPSEGYLRHGCAVLSLLLPCLQTSAASYPGADLFSKSEMKEVDLNGFKVWLGKPVQITAQLDWSVGGNGPDGRQLGWAFAHPIPSLNSFPQGNLLVTYSMNPDSQSVPQFVSAFQLSLDGGRHWGRRYNVIMLHNPMTFFPEAGDSMLGISAELMPRSPDDHRNFIAPTYLFENGGKQMTFFPEGMQVVDWPDPVELNASILSRENWHVGLAIYGSGVRIGRRLLATAQTYKRLPDGRRLFHNVLVASEDDGKTWRYFSTIAHYDPSLGSQDGYEGPNEAFMIRLPGGELMTVFRVGDKMRKWNLRRTFSEDGGLTWTKAEVIPPYSVKPALVRLANGLIAVSTGRPGIDLWLADSPHSQHWQRIDLLTYHNEWAPDPSYRIVSVPREDGVSNPVKPTTTSYTSMVEVAPNRILLTYDRCPVDRAPTGPGDLSRIFVLPIEVERN